MHPSDLIGWLSLGNELLLIVMTAKTKHILNPTGANGIIIRYSMIWPSQKAWNQPNSTINEGWEIITGGEISKQLDFLFGLITDFSVTDLRRSDWENLFLGLSRQPCLRFSHRPPAGWITTNLSWKDSLFILPLL